MTAGAKRVRKYRVHYIDARIDLTETTPVLWARIGKDNDDVSRSINYNTEETLNIWGETETNTTRQGDTLDVSPYYIRKGEPLGQLLQKIDIDELELDALKRDYVEVILDEESEEQGTAIAFRQTVDVKPTGAGGPANGADMIPFSLAFSGKKQKGNWDMSTKEFTPSV